jgi:8-oxo-dGTP pyrophosphatase MutT (NUDIX family)
LASGEAWQDGLRREVTEETGLEIEILRPLYVGEWRPTIKGIPHQIVAIFMVCKTYNVKPTLSDEHDAYKWVDAKSWQALNMMDPDDDVLRTYFAQ